ncbi:MAG: HD-like signal output (HDOD) protein [Myxococcota bacterium]|jgi:HD-like signal output (HDOD) protein
MSHYDSDSTLVRGVRPPAALLQATTPAWSSDELPSTETETRHFLQAVRQAIQTGRSCLPVMAPLLGTVKRLQQTPDVDIAELIQLVESEPAAAGPIVLEANSSGDRPAATSIRQAVTNVGVERVLDLLEHVAISSPEARRGEAAWQHLRRVWTHTAFTAIGARRIAQWARHPAPDFVHMAALFHAVGEPLLIQELSVTVVGDPGRFHSPSVLRDAAGAAHGEIGALLLDSWRVSASLVHLARCWEAAITDPLHAMVVAAREAALDYGYGYLDHRANPDRLDEALCFLPIERRQLMRLPAEIAEELNQALSMQR